ncbi:hypothetical protein GCU67_03720 [Modestobacter muralis]|uniref:Uncharacterized protein n=1 Tax=Modestobacter muralis TaxID=1608614 RepID=A0A6P0H5R9_9ACTN|nr:hypothetical protein [Modestobacter muralis]NEK93289.1 hypothetical protein [Modestobacter muralis]NEN50056.1 hypothetical protein [Modestobacter muralis]
MADGPVLRCAQHREHVPDERDAVQVTPLAGDPTAEVDLAVLVGLPAAVRAREVVRLGYAGDQSPPEPVIRG